MIIDFASKPPTLPFETASASHLRRYRRVYGASEARVQANISEGSALASYLDMYERAGARAVVIKARDAESTFRVKIRNEEVAAFCAEYGERYLGFAGADPHKGQESVREFEHAVRELGMRGLNLQCFEHRLPANDRLLYPLYAKCVELDVPVNVHVGINFSTDAAMGHGRPIHLDDVMRNFPELRVCASPPGWPWVEELVGVAWRHPNLWIGVVAVRPKYIAKAGSGYGALLAYGDGPLQDRIIFGSAWPMQPVDQAIAEIDALPLKEATRRKWLHDNAAAFLRLV